MKNKYAGCVVLYKPDKSVIDNIKSYIDSIGILYVLNNDSTEDINLKNQLAKMKKIKYINIGKSMGLAYALNMGAKLAIKDGFDYLLTMDQDSLFSPNAVSIIIDFIENSEIEYGIVGANAHAMYYDEESQNEKESYVELKECNKICNWIMTSGSMTNLHCYKQTRGFDDKMFIAHVDIDYGIQLQIINAPIIKLKDANIYQHFGNSHPVMFFGKKIHPNYDTPQRTYYLFRNQKYLKKKYPGKKNLIGIKLYKSIIKIICYEDKKVEKIKMAIRGYIDACRGIMGAYKG